LVGAHIGPTLIRRRPLQLSRTRQPSRQARLFPRRAAARTSRLPLPRWPVWLPAPALRSPPGRRQRLWCCPACWRRT